MGLIVPEPQLEVILTAYGDGTLDHTKVAFRFRSLDGQGTQVATMWPRIRALLEHVAEQVGGLHRGPTMDEIRSLFAR